MLGKCLHRGLQVNISYWTLFLKSFPKDIYWNFQNYLFQAVSKFLPFLPSRGCLVPFLCLCSAMVKHDLFYKQKLSDMPYESHGPFSILTTFLASANIFLYSVRRLIILGYKNKSNKLVAFLALAYWQPKI